MAGATCSINNRKVEGKNCTSCLCFFKFTHTTNTQKTALMTVESKLSFPYINKHLATTNVFRSVSKIH